MAETLAAAGSAPWGVCYHCQQALEKALKAMLVAAGAEPPRSHNLVRLNAMLDPPVFGSDYEEHLAALTVWAVVQRYPADQPEPTPGDAAQALTVSRHGMASIESRLSG